MKAQATIKQFAQVIAHQHMFHLKTRRLPLGVQGHPLQFQRTAQRPIGGFKVDDAVNRLVDLRENYPAQEPFALHHLPGKQGQNYQRRQASNQPTFPPAFGACLFLHKRFDGVRLHHSSTGGSLPCCPLACHRESGDICPCT